MFMASTLPIMFSADVSGLPDGNKQVLYEDVRTRMDECDLAPGVCACACDCDCDCVCVYAFVVCMYVSMGA